ncbi:MAG: hypothetical protein J7L94_05145 [Caldisericaceae bacterium]|nr:hypothetical protein [Caldisericaceae bacterium]
MKIHLLFALLILADYFSFLTAQNPQLIEDSTLTANEIVVTDSLSDVVVDSLKSLFMQTDSLRFKLIFKNDHRWNNWAIDTILTRSDLNSFYRILTGKQPYRLRFKYIPLKSQHFSKRQKIKRYLKPGLATLALLSNWGSFYLKRVADDYYERYQHTSNLRQINYYYHKTQQFDQWSNVLLGVSVISISVYLYLLLSD